MLYAFDSLTYHAPFKRSLQTWLIRGDRQTLVFDLPIALPPQQPSGGFNFPSQQARPLWVASDSCIVASDGSSLWLLRVDLRTRQVDTLRLPSHDVRLLPSRDLMRAPSSRGVLQQLGIPLGQLTPLPPTSLLRWGEISLDSDGHVWVNPWRPLAERTSPMTLLRVGPTGEVFEEVLPAFPVAFGTPGVFYALQNDPDTDEVFVARFERRR